MSDEKTTEPEQTGHQIAPVVRPPLSSQAAQVWELLQVGWELWIVIDGKNTTALIHRSRKVHVMTQVTQQKIRKSTANELMRRKAAVLCRMQEVGRKLFKVYQSV